MKKLIGYAFLAVVAFFLLIQLVPYGRNHTNPAVVSEPHWASSQVRQVAQRACFDCHSNETTWPWYSNIAPVSWLVYHDVQEGRSKLNFSEWNIQKEGGEEEAGEEGEESEGMDEITEVLQSGEMPMPMYLVMHPSAKLSETERALLIQSLQAAEAMR